MWEDFKQIFTQSQSIQTNEEEEEETNQEDDDFDFDINGSDLEISESEQESNNDTFVFNEPDDNYDPDNNENIETSIPNPQEPQSLYTGFKKIEWKHLEFGDNATTLGQALLDAGHIQDIREIRKPGSLPEIEAYCVPQTNVREKRYKINMDLDEKRKITKTKCDCRDGVLCKHLRGVIIYINTFREENEKTNLSCGFNQPSKSKQNMYPKGEELEIIDNIPAKWRMQKLTFERISDERKEYHANLMLNAGNTESPFYTICQMRGQPNLPTNATNLELPEWINELVFCDTDEQNLPFPYTHSEPRNNHEKEFYESKIVLSKEERFRLCVITQFQCCKTWDKERFWRFTASRAEKIIKAFLKNLSGDLSDEKLLELFKPSKLDKDKIPALKYGLDNEDNARNKYCETRPNSEVTRVGLAIKDKFSFFGASADGLIRVKNTSVGFYGLLEIKCIYSCRNGKIKGCKFLDKHGNLKKTHVYYMQVQLCAWATGAKFIHLFLWTEEDFKMIPVPLDEKFA